MTEQQTGARPEESHAEPFLMHFLVLGANERLNFEKVELRRGDEVSRAVILTKIATNDASEDVLIGSFLATKDATEAARKWILGKDPNPPEDEMKRITQAGLQLLKVLNFLD